MNYLSHHAVALDRYGENLPAAFYIGNVLPDLIATSGEGRLRPRLLPAETTGDDALLRGVRLHWETDRRFHGLPAFGHAQDDAKRLLHETPFETPPHRVFFLAHAAVEIALDGILLHQTPTIASDFYDRFATADLSAVIAQTQALFPPESPPLLALARTIERFVGSQYLREYVTVEGQAEALTHLGRRAGIAAFATDDDRRHLAEFFERLADTVRPCAEALLLRSEIRALVVE